MAESLPQKVVTEAILKDFFDAAKTGRDAALGAYLGHFPDAVRWQEQDSGCGWPALHYAASEDRTGTAKVLLDAGADPNALDKNGSTALMMAAVSDSAKVARMLLDAGAKPHVLGSEGETALGIAARLGKTQFIEACRQHAEDVQQKLTETTAAALTEGTDRPITVHKPLMLRH